MITFRDFCDDPAQAVDNGYRPSYLDLVSYCAVVGHGHVVGASMEDIRILRNFMDNTVRDNLYRLWVVFAPIVWLAMPILIWVFAIMFLREIRRDMRQTEIRREVMALREQMWQLRYPEPCPPDGGES
jgi:hypothetical protein